MSENLDAEVDLWLAVIYNAWYTALATKNHKASAKRKEHEVIESRDKFRAKKFFFEKNGTLDWICQYIDIDVNRIRSLFKLSLKDKKMRDAILNTNRVGFLNTKNKTQPEDDVYILSLS
jgi:hypothetical protein